MALWGGLQNRLQHLWGHRPPHAYSGPASGHDYRTSQVHSSWNPINHFDLAETLRDTTPADLIRYAHRPPSLLYAQNEWRRAEYYQKLSLRLNSIKPEEVGLESLLEARIAAARKSTVDGRVAEMRAIRSVVVGLHGIGNEETEKEGWKTRKQARRFVAAQIGPLAEMAASRGDTAAALEGFRALEDTGAITDRQLRTYGEILSNTDAASDATSLRIYLQCLEQNGWKTAVDPLLQAFQREVSEQLSIHENTPRHVVAERMALIARMHAGGGTLNVPPKSLGLGYLLLEQPGRAVHYLERACELDGHDGGETFFFLAQSLYRTDQWDKASTAFDRAAQLGYPQSRIAAWQGLALSKSGQWDAAYEVFRLAEHDLGPEADAMFFVYWARACYRMRALDQAKMRFRQAIEKSLENDEKRAGNVLDRIRAHYGLSVCLVNEGDLDGAIVQLKKALSMRVKFAPASHLLGWLLEQQERRGEALQCYRAAVEANPGDLVYVLSLGLVLDSDLKDDALPYLTKVVEGGKGEPEAVRRLAMGYHRKGEQKKARIWIERLVELVPGNNDCARWLARYEATEGTESFNRGAFADAVSQWEQVLRAWPDGPVIERLGLALLCNASLRLKQEWTRDLESVWPQIARAHQLAPCWDSRYLNALAMLVRGDYQSCQAEFAALDDGAQDHSTVKFLALLSRYLGGDDAAIDEISRLDSLPGLQGLNVLVGLLQIQAAARSGDFKLAAERIEIWLKLPDCMHAAGSNRSEINAMVWMCLKQAGWRPGRFPRLMQGLASLHGDFWEPALAVARAQEASKTRPGEGDIAKLEQCDSLFQAALESLPVADRGALLAEHTAFLRYRIEDAVWRGDLVLASTLLDRVETVIGAGSTATAHLRSVLDHRLHVPSHEKAFALIERDPEAARATWLERLNLYPGELASLEHLACLSWTRGYDAVRRADESRSLARVKNEGDKANQSEEDNTRDYEAAIAYFVEGLDYFRQLYEDESYWEVLRSKGRLLANPANPFNEAEFDAWKSSALKELAGILVDFAVHAANQDRKGGTARAKSALARLRNCGLPKGTVDALVAGFAERLLDRDPTLVPADQFEPAMARAERVLHMDPDNTKALEFVVRGHIYRAENSGSEDAGMVVERISSVRPRAERLEQQMSSLDEKTRTQVNRDLAAFWETLGLKAKRKAGEGVDALNALDGRVPSQSFLRNLLREIRKWLEESNQAYERAIRLDRTISLRATGLQQNNRELLDSIAGIERRL